MSQDLTSGILHYLTEAPISEFRLAGVTVLDHWQGEENLLWRVEARGASGSLVDAVVKFHLDAGQVRSQRQFDGMQFAAPLGIAPTALWVDRIPETLPRPILVYRWAEGEELDLADPSALDALAMSVAALHSADVEPLRRFSPRPLNLEYHWRIEQGSIEQIMRWLPPELDIVAAYRVLSTGASQLVEAAIPMLGQTPPAPIHGDLRLHHALLRRGQATLLDWEMFGIGDPALDCARFLQLEAQTLTPEQQTAWRDTYLAHSTQPAMGVRLGLYERLLAFDAVTYLLVGLAQNIENTPAEEWAEAMPFLRQTLTAAWLTAADKLGTSLSSAPDAWLDPFFAWLDSAIASGAT